MDTKRILAIAANHPLVAEAIKQADGEGGTEDVKIKRVIGVVLSYLGGPHPSHPEAVRVEELAALLKFVLAVIVEFGLAGEIPLPGNELPDDGDERPDQGLPPAPDQSLPGEGKPKPTPYKR